MDMKKINEKEHIISIVFSNDFDKYKEEYFEYRDISNGNYEFLCKTFFTNMIANYYDINIIKKANFFLEFFSKKYPLYFDLLYEIKFIDYNYYLDIFHKKEYKKLDSFTRTFDDLILSMWKYAKKIYLYEKKPNIDRIKPTYSDDEMKKLENMVYELFPEILKAPFIIED